MTAEAEATCDDRSDICAVRPEFHYLPTEEANRRFMD